MRAAFSLQAVTVASHLVLPGRVGGLSDAQLAAEPGIERRRDMVSGAPASRRRLMLGGVVGVVALALLSLAAAYGPIRSPSAASGREAPPGSAAGLAVDPSDGSLI